MADIKALALGDSIVWGQGNLDGSKFVGLVRAWLDSRGNTTDLTLLAHSGALAGPSDLDGAAPAWAEVPEDAPSVAAQVKTAASQLDPTTVKVLLINGGINDVSPFQVVMANPFDPDGLQKLDERTKQVFADRVPTLLANAVSTFPAAKIVVTGYYQIVSEQTGIRPLVQLMKLLPRTHDVSGFLQRVAGSLTDDILALAIATERHRIIEQCRHFAALSDQLLRDAVAKYASSGRVFFASPGFGPDNAFAAPHTWLWSGVDDPLYPQRQERYAQHILQNPFDWPVFTPLASMCHPNVAGSAAYAQAIEQCLAGAGL
jgi:lysophospholipase L1-like esterase